MTKITNNGGIKKKGARQSKNPAVVASLWYVDDPATKELMVVPCLLDTISLAGNI